jgi:NhaA family Na+:H+ antiporter
VSIFIATLAFADAPALLADAKLGIIFGSLASGVLGFLVLRFGRTANP